MVILCGGELYRVASPPKDVSVFGSQTEVTFFSERLEDEGLPLASTPKK